MKKEKLIKKYDRHVIKYENNLHNPTLTKWRKQLVQNAYGKVLEVGVGTGANFPFYNRDNVQITGVDFSPEMIKSAKRTASMYQIEATFMQEDIEELNLEHNAYDCIISTLSLCSYPNPVATLNKFNSWCRKDGIILLMEHGLSSNPILSFSQHIVNPLFKRIAGCNCNRDMQAIVSRSNLQIEKIDHYWKNIISLIHAKPSK